MKLGLIISLNDDLETEFAKVHRIGFPTCQLNCWEQRYFTPEIVQRLSTASRRHKVEITAVWCGWEGPVVWDFESGPVTLGLVPPAYRQDRLKTLMRGADFAAQLGVKNLITHAGYIPENLTDPEYPHIVVALRLLVSYCRKVGVNFLFETGQETPVVLLRVIEDIGLDNVGVNLDPANLIAYGKANPVDALDVIGKYVRDVHAKDALYPTTGRQLGVEVPLGAGKVNFPSFIARLKEIGYDGPLTIEREITGEQQIKDILMAKELLEGLI